MESNSPFPNYMQMRQPLPLAVWHGIRILSVGVALGLCITLFARPELGLFLFWGVLIPFVPLLFFLAPGIWRNICPLAAVNQTPRLFEFTKGLTAPNWFKEYGYVIAISLFLIIVSTRKVIFNYNGPALAVLILLLLAGAFTMGNFFKGKSGWCSSICPLLPIQRIYGQTPFLTVPNSHCQPSCIGCTKNCYDFNPKVAYLADMNDADNYFSGYRKFFVGLFPGFILGYYTIPNPPEIPVLEMYGTLALYAVASAGLFSLAISFVKRSAQQIAVVFGAVALNFYYWFNAPVIANLFGEAAASAVIWGVRGLVLALTLIWIYRTVAKERLFFKQAEAEEEEARGGNDSLVSHRASLARNPEVVIDGKRIVIEGTRTILELAEANGLDIEAGCRMGVCGADPVSISSGMENLSKKSSDEKTTLERLGLGDNCRMACVTKVKGAAEVSLKPEEPKVFSTSVVEGFPHDKSIKKVVVIGNGIAGVTAADHVRRRHPSCEIHLVGRERHHLYNRMGITRLIYGRSAMQGLYLLPEKWYDDYAITTWLNTNVTGVDSASKTVALGTGESLEYDRLILTTGSSSFVPPIDGWGKEGCYVLREAEDAMAIRSFVQDRVCNHAIVAGGGLLGLEAAYGLSKIGLQVSVLERSTALLRRQLDARGGEFLRSYLEGLGITIVMEAETESVQGQNRIEQVSLKDGRTLPCDLLLVAAGIRSELTLAKEMGLETNRGVVVNESMQTTQAGIFAAGDVAEFNGKTLGLWPVAVAQAEVAAANAVAVGGELEATYEEIVPVTMLKVVGVDLTSIGRFLPDDGEREIVDDNIENQRYRKLVVTEKEGKTIAVGAILIGYPQQAQAIAEIVKSGMNISSVLRQVESDNWDGLVELVE